MGELATDQLEGLARRIRYSILTSSTEAGSGHPTSSLSAVELMTALLFGGVLRYNPEDPNHPNNDRLIFSKGHASPLLYALWAAAGCISEEELMTVRRFGSPLEGHPTPRFRYAEAATGSLGQGLSIGVGMALNARYLDELPYRTFVLLGDSEMAEGSVWEAIQIAAYYKLNHLIGILDVNRLGQRGETMYGHDTGAYAARIAAFGWEAVEVDGHDLSAVLAAYERAVRAVRPAMIVARTLKGKGVSFLEDKEGWHGKPLKKEELAQALKEIGQPDRSLRGQIARPADVQPKRGARGTAGQPSYDPARSIATREAYGLALKRISSAFPEIVVLDGEVSNSTGSEIFQVTHPDRFFEMFIAEQNMVGAAVGLARRGKIPFVSTFAAFFTRAFDQIRMSRYSEANIKFCGSHAGVSIGEDGPSQMGLEDLAMFRTLLDAVVLYPADAVSTDRLVEEAAGHRGIVYMRTTRGATPILYGPDERFSVGGSKVLRRSDSDRVTLVAAGITVHEALAASEELARGGIPVRIIDLYSVKPLDEAALIEAARETGLLITVEDHVAEGGIGDAVRSALAGRLVFADSASAGPSVFADSASAGPSVRIVSLAVRKVPMSGKPAELLDYEGISRTRIARAVREALRSL